jgi:CRISPR-associated protein Cmr4
MRLLFVHAFSPLHAGTGLSDGAIELAIARDRATGHPLLPGSSIKGPLRDRAGKHPRAKALFGPDTANASDHAGALVFGDANLLLLPVRSVAGTFAWVTSPYLLRRFARDCVEAGLPAVPMAFATPATREECLVMTKSLLSIAGTTTVPHGRTAAPEAPDRVIFEDLDFTPKHRVTGNTDHVRSLADWIAIRLFPDDQSWQTFLRDRFCVVHDDAMTFLSKHAMDVVARVKLKDDTKTVDNLWHEESLPTETVLVSVVEAIRNAGSRDDRGDLNAMAMLDTLGSIIRPDDRPGVVQLGGKSTVGRGRCRLVLVQS